MKKMISIIIALLLMAMGTVAFAEAAAPTNAGILRISVSASDLATTKAFFDDVMEMDFVAEGELDKETVKTLYGMDASAKYAMYKNGLQNTLVQVLEFDPKPTKKAREGFNVWDGGYFDIAYRCQDNDEAYAKFSGMGYEFPTPPYRYVTSWSNSEVLEAVMFGPDNMPIALMGKTKSTPAFEGTFRNMPDSVLIVDSIEEADKYYVDTLGVSKVFDMVLEAGLVEPIFNLEGNAQIHMTMYMGTDAATPVIEIISFEALDSVSITEKGGVLGDYAGKFATCFEVADLDEAIAKHEANGFAKYGEVTEYELAPYGKIRSCVVHGPSKALMELYQIVK
ncbi:MAG: hypothetical protein IJ381_03690 [Clostridia bacterium]|nr:hypothetical protein [Clostridia bacterium]